MAVVSGSILLCGYSWGFLGDGASYYSEVIENTKTSIFRAFGHYVFGTLGNEANIIVLFTPIGRGVQTYASSRLLPLKNGEAAKEDLHTKQFC